MDKMAFIMVGSILVKKKKNWVRFWKNFGNKMFNFDDKNNLARNLEK